VAELDSLREKLQAKLKVGNRRLNQLILQKEGETLLPRRLAILALASENRIPIGRLASEDDLSQLRAVAGPRATAPGATPPPGTAGIAARRRKTESTQPAKKRAVAGRRRKVFVVHGRNEELRKSMFDFLRSLSLEPIEWRKAIALTGSGSPSIGEILDAAFEHAIAVVVLLTPDDDVILKKEFRKGSDPAYERRYVGQARANVLFEAGMAFGRYPTETVLVQVGVVKPFSDIGGRHVTRLRNDAESRAEFVTKLRNANCALDDGGTDWYKTGDFQVKEKVDGAK
jgi:predicted nucleotide-binding protein